MGLFKKILNLGEGRKLKLLESIVPEVSRLEPEMERRSDAELAALTPEYRQRVDNGEDLDELLPEAFATVREAARRSLGQRHFDVQVMGGSAALQLRRDEDGRADPRLHHAGIPQCARRQGAPRHHERLSRQARRRGWAESTGSSA
jgi:hypothetical protein